MRLIWLYVLLVAVAMLSGCVTNQGYWKQKFESACAEWIDGETARQYLCTLKYASDGRRDLLASHDDQASDHPAPAHGGRTCDRPDDNGAGNDDDGAGDGHGKPGKPTRPGKGLGDKNHEHTGEGKGQGKHGGDKHS